MKFRLMIILIMGMIFNSNENHDFSAFTIAFALVILGDILLMVLVLMDGSGSHF